MKTTLVVAALAALATPGAAFHAGLAVPTARNSISLPTAVRRTSHSRTALCMREADGHVGRRAVLTLTLAGALGLRQRPASAATMTEEEELKKLQAEAARIQEIFDVQKELNSNLPSLKDSLQSRKAAVSEQDAVATRKASPGDEVVDAKNLMAVIDKIMTSLKNEGEDGLRTVLAYSAPRNPIKNMPLQNVINSMRDSEYGVLFGKFTNYEIKPPTKAEQDPEEGTTYSVVDVVVKAPYDTMLQNGVQFKELLIPKESGKLCEVTFRWNFQQLPTGSWVSDGCYAVPLNQL